MGYLIPVLHEIAKFCLCFTWDTSLTFQLKKNFHIGFFPTSSQILCMPILPKRSLSVSGHMFCCALLTFETAKETELGHRERSEQSVPARK
jgi:hypothetical protein